jgi:glycosyltransferase involved in cell wall biosynthesis
MLSAKKNRDDSSADQYYLPQASSDFRVDENRNWFRDFVRKENIEVIINQNGATPTSVWPLEWSKDLPIRRLTVYHSDLESLWSCHKEVLMDNVIVKVLHLKSWVNGLWKRLFRVKYRHWLRIHHRLSDRIVFLTNKYYSGFEWFSGIKIDSRFFAIYNPKEDKFTLEIEDSQKENIVLFVGRLSKEKQIDYLLRIWRNVTEKHPDWNLVIVGDGPMKLFSENIVADYQLTNVTFEGYQNPLEYYKRAKIFCLTSSVEGFSLVLVEAMGCGCVPMAFNSYACASDIIDDGKCGFLIEPFDIDAYAQRLSLLMQDNVVRQSMVKEGKKKSQQFSLENILNEWEKLFL